MKKHLFLLCILFFAIVPFANSQDKIAKYCQVRVGPKGGFTSKRKTEISFGDDKNLFAFSDTAVLQKLRMVNQLTTETDVLNYMSKLGWELVNVHSAYLYTTTEIFYFRKSFDNTELIQ
jgi:hypothetical protein